MPLMLRLRLLECLRALAIQIEQLQSQSEEADFWANRLITAARHGSPRLLKMMAELVEIHPEPTAHFASELVAHLYDEEAALPMVSDWLERSLRAPLLEVMQQEHRRQAVQQTTLANVINSCRRLAQIEWREFFEATSWAETELATDPAGVYARMDFGTRDRCRSAVEEIARWSKTSGTGSHRAGARPGECGGGRRRAARRLLSDRCRPASARAVIRCAYANGGTLAPPASSHAAGYLLREYSRAHSPHGGWRLCSSSGIGVRSDGLVLLGFFSFCPPVSWRC